MDAVFMTAHGIEYGENCLDCHDGVETLGKTFDHNALVFTLAGKHAGLRCVECHTNARSRADFKDTVGELVTRWWQAYQSDLFHSFFGFVTRFQAGKALFLVDWVAVYPATARPKPVCRYCGRIPAIQRATWRMLTATPTNAKSTGDKAGCPSSGYKSAKSASWYRSYNCSPTKRYGLSGAKRVAPRYCISTGMTRGICGFKHMATSSVLVSLALLCSILGRFANSIFIRAS
ncbi:hypothetical protein GW781_13340 [bacterium]|nr:hypothetical protein [bacterium]NCT22122.1 hypothetical protein [bacterium]